MDIINTTSNQLENVHLYEKEKAFSVAFFRLLSSWLYIVPREARLINLSGRAGPSGAKPRDFERKIYLYICMYVCIFS